MTAGLVLRMLLVISMLAALGSIIFACAAHWYAQQADLWWRRPDEAIRREARHPWFVRVAEAILDRFNRGRS